jgi:hypothetical protein
MHLQEQRQTQILQKKKRDSLYKQNPLKLNDG